MNRREWAAVLGDHGENYDGDGYHGCDCGYPCSATEHSDHLASVVMRAIALLRWRQMNEDSGRGPCGGVA